MRHALKTRRAAQTVAAFLLMTLLSAHGAHATTVLGVTSSTQNTGGVPKSILSADTGTGDLTSITPTFFDANSLAWNRANLYYYGQQSGRALRAYNTDDATDYVVSSDLNLDATMPANNFLSGSATFDPASGRYYYNPEASSGEAGTLIHWIEFDATGLVIAGSGTIAPDFSATGKDTLGNFGDLAVGPDGFLYGASDNRATNALGNSLNSFWKLDLSDPTFAITTFGPEFDASDNSRVSPQIAFDENGDLWANFWDEGEMFKVNLTTGDLTNMVTLGDGSDFSDMASTWTERTEIEAVPEPTTFVLAVLGLMSLAMRRRRRR
ncbi:MAG: PEP-CTERM sorting domain-containing protein [Pirellulales bacterium]|nr:PEP-CTERM sorting domain-containing protein [Pirellulales bacterium]